jgi:ribosome-associated heat shock protein Hsp15
MTSNNPQMERVRLDKWLWAARFFKTRSLAKQAIEAGKVHYEGDRVKVSKEVCLGATLQIRQGWDQKTVVVTGLSDRRGPASSAQALYQETPESIAARERLREERSSGPVPPGGRPQKRDRRLIHRFKTEHAER